MGLVPWALKFFETLFFWGWFVTPVLPIALGWRAWRRANPAPRRDGALLMLATASYAWLLLAIPFPDLLGPSYEWPRFALILAHLAGMIVLAFWAVVRAQTLRPHVVIAAVLVATQWLLTLVANSVL